MRGSDRHAGGRQAQDVPVAPVLPPSTADLVIPDNPRGWVLIGRSSGPTEPQSLERAVLALSEASLATMVVDLPHARAATQAGSVQAGAAHVRDALDQRLPIGYLGVGSAAAPGWIAAARGGIDGVCGWNPQPRGAWSHLSSVTVPSLLVVDQDASWNLAVARAAAWRLGRRSDLVSGVDPGDLSVLTDWLERRLLTPPVAPAARRSQSPRSRVAAIGVAAALAAAPAGAFAASVVSMGLPDFSTGKSLSASQIGGDQAATGSDRPTVSLGEFRLTAAQIGGDGKEVKGPHDDPPLVDGIGLRWNINTNIGFTTTSSASAAVSEAGFTHAVAASTLNGGTVNQVLADAFDGYNALCVDLNNVGGQCNTANMAVYNQNGPGSLECSGRQVVTPLRTIGNFQVRRKLFVPTNEGFARWLNIFRNTSASNQTVRMVTSNNLGSDANTRIVTTSDGDATPELSDTWVTTFQNYVGSTSSDPRLGHVLRGLGAPVGLAVNNFANGDDNPFWRYQFTLAPGQTGVIMNFATGQASKVAAATEASTLANLSSANALACMTTAERSQVVNFVASTGAILTTQASAGGPVGTSVSDTATLAGFNAPTGTITFNLYGPDDANCANAAVFTDVVAVAGNSNYPSGSFAPAAAGTYRWTAAYSGDGINPPATSSCNAANEAVVITAPGPSISTQASPGGPIGTALTDTATLSGGASPTGDVTFRLFSEGTCTTEVFKSTNNLTGLTATSGSFAPAAPGTYYWTAVYNGDANNATATSGCNAPNESAAISKATPTISTQASPGGPIGTSLTDTATVSGGFSPTGKVTFRLYSNNTCTTQVFTSTNDLAGSTATSGSFAPAAPGTYFWTAVYTGDVNNNQVTSACNAPNESAIITKAGPTISTQASAGGPVGSSVTDTATLSGGASPTGTVTFRLFSNNTCTTQVFTSTNALVGATATSGSFVPAAPGTYFWTAVYNGDAKNNTATSACLAPNESAVITKASPTISTQASPGNLLGAPVRDVATVSGGASPTGTVTFRLFSNNTCTTQVFTSTNPLAGGTATSGWFTPAAAGTYYWTAVYNGDAKNNTATSACLAPNESVTITAFQAPAPTRTITGDFIGPVTVNAGESVLITNARVVGPVTVNPGGALTVVNSRITGGIVANAPGFFSLCGTDVSPPTAGGTALSVTNAAVPIRVGDPATGCAGNRFAGQVSLTNNLAVTFGANAVSHNATINNNGPGAIVVKANTVFGTLGCAGNNPAPTNVGQPNSGAVETGQCAGL